MTQSLSQGVVSVFDEMNRRHPWSHNDHFHRWVLRRLPDRRGRALDVGCGRGELVGLLSTRFARVDGVDRDEEMAEVSSRRFAGDSRITITRDSFVRVSGRYDLVVMIAVLHHLDLQPALRHAADLLTGGGRLLVVGLARAATPLDRLWDLASALLNPIMGFVKHPRRAGAPGQPPFPVLDPAFTYDEINAVAARVLPGARMRRRLFFRYTLEWTKPPPSETSGLPGNS